MPITKELDNINELEAVGFSHEQSKTLAKIIEKSHLESQQDLKEFIRNEFKDLRNIDIANIHSEIKAIDTKLTGEIRAIDTRLTGEIKAIDTKLTGEIKAIDTKLTNEIKAIDTKLTGEIKAIDTKLTNEIKAIDTKLTGEIKAIDARLTGGIKAIDDRLTSEINLVKAELKQTIAESQRDMLLKFVGIMSALIGIAVAIIKLF